MASSKGKIRIIGGEWRSRIVTFPNQMDLRPTPDRVRETVFNWLGQDLSGKICLDLFAGSGVMGFEAASRGAKQAVMVEADASTFKVLRANADQLQATQVELKSMDAITFINIDSRRFDIIFLDPPYRLGLLPELLPLFATHLAEGGLVYVESEEFLVSDERWQVLRSKQSGKVCYQLLELANANR
jgi:16S rRNA (guanine966-N2)-methyltransferase